MGTESHIVRIISNDKVTHDVVRIRTTRPENYNFVPGQATELAINKPNWEEARRPFTFTCLPEDNYLEFTIKTYPSRGGVTNELLNLVPPDELILHDVWGAIHFKGPGIFIAGGAGVTPFIAIFRHLAKTNKLSGNRLVFANKSRKDIILEKEFKEMLGDNMVNILSDEKASGYEFGMISKDFLAKYLEGYKDNVYVCGPPPMMDAIQRFLTELGIAENSVTVEI